MIISEPFNKKNYPTHNFKTESNKISTTINLQSNVYTCIQCNLIIKYFIFKNKNKYNKQLYIIHAYFNDVEQLNILNCAEYIIKNIIE